MTGNHWSPSQTVTHVHASRYQDLAIGTPVVDVDGETLASPVNGAVTDVAVARGSRIDAATPLVSVEVPLVEGRHYVIALLYEPGMGLTLWARNTDAYDEFTSLVDPREDLALASDLAAQFERLEELTHIGWERAIFSEDESYEPAEPDATPWRYLTDDEFDELDRIDVQELVERAGSALGPGYSVVAGAFPLPRRDGARIVEYEGVRFLSLDR